MAPTTSFQTTTQYIPNSDPKMIGSNNVGPITWDDATWILTSSFIIFTMQSGFGLLEAGSVSGKNEVNIMVKNAIDVIFGGLSYWMFGFGLSFGEDYGTNPFCGVGHFFVDTSDENMGILFSTFVFQMSFATTATTIVSGAMAERTKLTSYVIFSFFNTLIYCIPAHWTWASNGFLRVLGMVDVAGSGAVHLVGGVSAFVAAALLRPRIGRYDNGTKPLPLGNPVSSLIGMFMLWWGWLAFNCGSTFGISGGKWKLAARSAVTTLNASIGGGVAGVVISLIFKKRKYDVGYIVNSVLGALVSITAICAVVKPWEALLIGSFAGALVISSSHIIAKIRVDDPVCASSVHGICGLWGLLAVGLFARFDPLEDTTQGRSGLFHGGGFYLLGVQTLGSVAIIAWSGLLSLTMLLIIRRCVGLRLTEDEEKQGADFVEHMIGETDDKVEAYRKEQQCEEERSETPISTITNLDKNQIIDVKRKDENKQMITKFQSAVRRGSLIARMTTNNMIRHDKVVPINNGHVEQTLS